MEQVLGTCLDGGIKVVTNAGGLDPAGCADAVRDLAGRLGLAVRVAHVEGDDLLTASTACARSSPTPTPARHSPPTR